MHIEEGQPPKTTTLPVKVTERIVSSKPLDEISWWEISPEPGSKWSSGVRPSAFFTVTDENMNDIIDYSRPPMNANLSTRIMGFTGPDVVCKGIKEQTYFVSVPSLTIPNISLKNATNVVLVKYDLQGIRPEDGIYHMKFASFYEVKIELPKGATITSDDIPICSISDEKFYEKYKPRVPDSRMVIIYDIKFKLE